MSSRPLARRAVLAGIAVACVVFLALAVWQVERRAWKLQLIDKVERRVHAPPLPVPPRDRWPAVNAADDEYRHVRASGTLLDDAETLVQASTELGAGFWVMTPLRLADGSVVLINRGFVPPERRERAAHGAGMHSRDASVIGLLRMTEPHGGFLRSNDEAANRWYSRDVTAIAAARGLHDVAPFFVDADAGVPPDATTAAALPVGGLTVVSFANNHAVYAITWFALALMAGFGGWRVWRHAAGPRNIDDDANDASHGNERPDHAHGR